MIRVEVFQDFGFWLMIVYRPDTGQLIKLWSFKRLIQALELACTLQIHINNADELPIKQYYYAESEDAA